MPEDNGLSPLHYEPNVLEPERDTLHRLQQGPRCVGHTKYVGASVYRNKIKNQLPPFIQSKKS